MSEFEKWFESKYVNASESTKIVSSKAWQAAKADSAREIAELKATINELREALEIARDYQFDAVNQFHNDFAGYKDEKHEQYDYDLKLVENALASTPALKRNEFPNSANLDIYNSVIFSDAPYGTMIMESKIVKWLCRNRAKDYFDKLVEGK